ncbi:pericentriolar material 1 protein isoform X3 [Lingula anatina]|uniref:Pericentriolar material 1 protein isoform X3 n=1 Tax=Lingula anatina TaxID=7574 RepID=A0A1S3IJ23_LINAN|nr:pericentriolar material 1 protein isoform X3 [Lingula anatina]|eukprot:XP_013397504.1 pericentriolar material 1 protein isoform X3 [Lingula anatina]
MATGGIQMARSSRSEPRRPAAYRSLNLTDRDDKSSASSALVEDRPNNWDFSDWRPGGAPFDQSRVRAKKGNPEREKEKEQSLSLESTPVHEQKHRTPFTFPRTRITASTPASQRVALENLKQQLTYSDAEEISTDGERNNERHVPIRRENPSNYLRQEMFGSDGNKRRTISGSTHTSNTSNLNTNPNAEEPPDSNQIVSRLMQIRDYLKQANSMIDSLQNSSDTEAREQIGKLNRLVDHLREQEKGYMGLLQRMLAAREEGLGINGAVGGGSGESGNSKVESIADSTSIDIDMQSDISEATTDRSFNAFTRPKIEDHLMTFSEMEDNEPLSARSHMSTDSTQSLPHIDVEQFFDRDSGSHSLESQDSRLQDSEIQALRHQQELLKKLLYHQQQLRDLQDRQAGLLKQQQEAEKRLSEVKESQMRHAAAATAIDSDQEGSLERTLTADGTSRFQMLRNRQEESQDESVSQSEQSEQEEEEEVDPEVVPEELQALRQRLSYLKSLYERQDDMTDSVNLSADEQSMSQQSVTGSEMTPTTKDRKQLKGKLQELQDKKQKMDRLLLELQSLRSQRDQMNNEVETGSTTSSQIRISQSIAATASANETANEANDMLEMLDARHKLKKLQEVRGRLNQLRDLVQYYQTGREFIHEDGGEDEDASSLPAFSDYEDPELMKNLKKLKERGTLSDQLYRYAAEESQSTSQQMTTTTEDETTDETEESASVLSSNLGAYGDDPEIQEKVKKLKAAKEKLKRLQQLVAMVQQSPEAAQVLPDDLAELAASIDDLEDGDTSVMSSQATQTQDEDGQDYGTMARMEESSRDQYYQAKMKEQKQELDALMEERKKLMAIQYQLQLLHEQFPDEEASPNPGHVNRQAQSKGKESVTFKEPELEEEVVSMNDELWGKMRKQRMLQEELRQKKKELEDLMRKDRNNKTYIRNQDNQSDLGYGMSVQSAGDVTMATWGGSTVDNPEDTFDDYGQDDDDDDIDDGYPSDGIVQVEEEEEARDDDDDRGTYTIDEEYQRRERQRGVFVRPPVIDDESPSDGRMRGGARPKFDPQDPRNRNPWSKSPLSSGIYQRGWPTFSEQRRQRAQQQNYRSAEEIIKEDEDNVDDGQQSQDYIVTLQRQLENTNDICRTLLQDQQALMEALSTAGISIPSNSYRKTAYSEMIHHYRDQMQQQQLLFNVNQMYYQMSQQQAEIHNLHHQLQSLLRGTGDEGEEEEEELRLHPNSVGPWGYPPMSQQQSPLLYPPYPMMNPSPVFSPDNRFSPYVSPYASGMYPYYPGLEQQMRGQPQKLSTYSDTIEPSEDENPFVIPSDPRYRPSHPPEPAPPPPSSPVPKLNLREVLKPRKRRRQDVEDSARSELSEKSGSAVIGQVYPTPSRANAAARLASRRQPPPEEYRPGLSANISGTAFMDTASLSSYMSSLPGGESSAREQRAKINSELESDTPSEFSLFEALRETIYSEVATLISQNETRPHFLIELFRELQMLNSDYLRQRALYAIQDLVTRFLTEESVDASESTQTPLPPWLLVAGATGDEQTPSESLITSDEEEVRAKLYEMEMEMAKGKSSDRSAASLQSGSIRSDRYDYVERADTSSTMSTPPSGTYWDSPFAQDLGETVIHLDKAMQKVRDYERRMQEAVDKGQAANVAGLKVKDTSSVGTSSSAQDPGSESSISDVPYPRIDTQQLDQQIKSIMTEVIPVLKEHMEDVCSTQLLAYIQRLVLTLTKQQDDGQEFVRFFHKQLGSLLQDSLAKFDGRKMRECAEDLLVDMSEVLFNELAFFRLMQDLDETTVEVRTRAKKWAQESQTSTETTEDGLPDQDETEDSSEEEEEEEEEDEESEDGENTALHVSPKEEEDLGKARDDEMAYATDMGREDDESLSQTPINIELAVSETKPFTRIGSDEDEDEEEETQSADDPSETAVSREEEKEKSSGESPSPSGPDASPSSSNVTVIDTTTAATSGGDVENRGGGDAENGATYMNGEVVIAEEEIEIVTVDDLPPKMSGLEKQAQVENQVNEEAKASSGTAAVLSTMPSGEEELAGDGAAIREPGTFSPVCTMYDENKVAYKHTPKGGKLMASSNQQ